ncbi:exodeoxyribonuclease VII large subunit [Tibeticola sp.]|uniref:exodeoxyribonuclease VII large subunit n=1 Tax=Tibeticola sp. TaxID=2005368 RepID=UPI00258C0E6D|nr:exodeoxyribonuclease VII large subunit [Tibeticola sp.]MCI4440154.1 exodeoxyribonuclease VII large subunit [Tibeticola sp.]
MIEADGATVGSAWVWDVAGLCRAAADALAARFNPVRVRGEISGFTRASSGHCYFSLKDAEAQIRCALFRRHAAALSFAPRDGDSVEVYGRLGVYEARGDLQLIVEDIRRAGQGALFEQFLRLRARLEAEGLFDAARKRVVPPWPRGVGLVTSPGAAALHDVITTLRRRVPHVPVLFSPASVQGAQAAPELMAALERLYAHIGQKGQPPIDLILLVRGGGSLEDLWAFNDEQLARTLARSPVPVISGVGHETDFTIADFVADVRAPTPTAAAEWVAPPREQWMNALQALQQRIEQAVFRQLDVHAQRLDLLTARLGRPSGRVVREQQRLQALAQRLRFGLMRAVERRALRLEALDRALPTAAARALQQESERLHRLNLRLQAIDPRAVLARGYALLSDPVDPDRVYTRVADLQPGQKVRAQLADGAADMTVSARVAS